MQEKIALAIVALTALAVLVRFFRSVMAGPVSRFLLKRGRIKWAMKVKSAEREAGCDHCKH